MSNLSGRAIGYARVSTDEQNLDLQIDALEAAGCLKVYSDQGVSAVAKNRQGFEKALSELQSGDVFVIWKMDRAFRSLRHALDVLEQLENRDIQFRSLTDQIDTTTPMGKCMYQIRNVFAELERNLISERTKAGMEAARKRGKHIGRPKKLTRQQVEWAKAQLSSTPPVTLSSVAKTLDISTKTLNRSLKIAHTGLI
ncbi:recombinase family protein [Porticoccus sp. W117]|uniref:recombinase family protein n=1 Tax=Porticoccus sp. W117 TaxID=3054777 RepID=UPI0025913053|nr:recombinase family protein [Porticoccus sp. W117]MDM3871796.1 recombinase family protein [Porticoccus sp. W117]